MLSMEAYLDNYDRVCVWLNKEFYGGKSEVFAVLDEEGNVTRTMIECISDYDDRQMRYYLKPAKELEFGKDYIVREQHGQIVPLVFRNIVQTERFNETFYYDGDDLGPRYHRMYTNFALWAPTAVEVILRVRVNGKSSAYMMTRTEKGVWRVRVDADLKYATYVYLVKRNGKVVETLDPYALSSTGNSKESAVIDKNELKVIPFVKPGGSCTGTDAIIYECSVRDMTSSEFSGTQEHRTFNALAEEKTTFKNIPTGLNYLSSLGVTHVQLMPVLDFLTVDEFNPTVSYNWGYDPVQYLSLEGSFSSEPRNPYARMLEFRRLVSKFHEHKMRVNLDVVFNHFYDAYGTCFQRTVPYYFFRYTESGHLSNGSFCGNDFASDQPMARKYLAYVIEQLIKVYDVDGFRFDLMGIIDIETMNLLRDTAKALKPDVMIYGEGWNMPTHLAEESKSCIYNQLEMPEIGHFNDYFRDVIKGKTADDQKYDKGYATGDILKAQGVLSALAGNVLTEPFFMRFSSPEKTINGPETHDNSTVWDKMHYCCQYEDRETRKKRQKLMIAMTMVSQGIPFIHSGLEFCRTKNDSFNSYNLPDEINSIDWNRVAQFYDVVEFTRRAIALRKKYKGLHLSTTEEISKGLHLSVAEGGIIFYDINYDDQATGVYAIRVVINPLLESKYYEFDSEWKVVFDENGTIYQFPVRDITIKGLSLMVLVK